MKKLYGLTESDLMKLRDLARRVGGGSGTQQPRRKKRRYPRGSSPGTGTLTAAVIFKDCSPLSQFTAPNLASGDDSTAYTLNPTLTSAAAIVLAENAGTTGYERRRLASDPTKFIPPADVWNLTQTTLRASTAEPIAVMGKFVEYEASGAKKYLFVVAGDKDVRSVPNFNRSVKQALFHQANAGAARLDGKDCPTP